MTNEQKIQRLRQDLSMYKHTLKTLPKDTYLSRASISATIWAIRLEIKRLEHKQ